jgi:cytochrome c-type biogenesis protein CcmH/NrfG
MTRLVFAALACVLWATASFAQSAPAAGLAAEGAGDWATALQIYRRTLDQNPHDAALWVRVADIEAHLNRPSAALEAIERALALSPDSVPFLRARATLGTWAGQYDRAEDAYRRLVKLVPDDRDVVVSLARVCAWSGRTDAAVARYRQYLRTSPDAAAIWIELARAEMWRGNYSASFDALETYRQRFGKDEEYARGLAAVLARAGRPRQALELVDPLLAAHPDDFDLNATRTMALASGRRIREASDALDALRRLRPAASETRAIEGAVRETIDSSAGAGVTAYRDSSTLEIARAQPRAAVALGNGTTLGGGADAERLRAGKGSHLEQIDGSESARHDFVWLSAAHQVSGVNLRGRVGQARTSADTLVAYTVGADFAPLDGLRFSLDRDSGFLVVSPRTVGLGLRQVSYAGRLEWAPGARVVIAFDGRFQSLSDGNERWEFTFAPRYSVARTHRLNLDMGVMVAHLGARTDLDHGYYDPSRYQYYGITAYPYWKLRDTIGLGLSLSFGMQADDFSPAFRPGGHATADATIGLVQSWALKVSGAGSFNQRLNSGAFDGLSAGLSLIRRF